MEQVIPTGRATTGQYNPPSEHSWTPHWDPVQPLRPTLAVSIQISVLFPDAVFEKGGVQANPYVSFAHISPLPADLQLCEQPLTVPLLLFETESQCVHPSPPCLSN